MSFVVNLNDVFVSYSRKNKPFVRQLVERLQADGFSVWVDWEDIPSAADWWDEIKAGITGADTVVFVTSPQSATSEVCYRELQYAVNHNKRLLPALYEPLTGPAQKALHPAVSATQWTDFHAQDFEAAYARLRAALQTDLDYLRAHKAYLVRAREWHVNDRHADFLLAGPEAAEAARWLDESATKDPPPSRLHREYIRASTRRTQPRAVEWLRPLGEFLLAAGGGALALGSYIVVGLDSIARSMAADVTLTLVVFSLAVGLVRVVFGGDETRFVGRLPVWVLRALLAVIPAVAVWALPVVTQFFERNRVDPAAWAVGVLALLAGLIIPQRLRLRGWQAVPVTAALILVALVVTENEAWFAMPLLMIENIVGAQGFLLLGLPFALLLGLGLHATAVLNDLRGLWRWTQGG